MTKYPQTIVFITLKYIDSNKLKDTAAGMWYTCTSWYTGNGCSLLNVLNLYCSPSDIKAQRGNETFVLK